MTTIDVVAAVIVDDNGKVFCTQRGYGDWKGWWEFPGGKIANGETPQKALVREIEEELATVVEVGDSIATVEYDYPQFHLSMQCFVCKITSGCPTLLEHEDAKWLLPSEMNHLKWLPADKDVVNAIQQRWQ